VSKQQGVRQESSLALLVCVFALAPLHPLDLAVAPKSSLPGQEPCATDVSLDEKTQHSKNSSCIRPTSEMVVQGSLLSGRRVGGTRLHELAQGELPVRAYLIVQGDETLLFHGLEVNGPISCCTGMEESFVRTFNRRGM
jgi:hypothetical protein